MESLDLLNLRADECSFLETILADVRGFVKTYVLENEKQVVLVFPPLCARKRFLIHTLVQHFFNDLNTISIGSSYGRRTVVYHSSLKPQFCETDLKQSSEMPDENNTTSFNRAYRTPSERKAQEKLLQSLMPKKSVDKSLRSTQRKRPDIPIYVPKARRGSANTTVSNISSTTNSFTCTSLSKLDLDSKTQDDINETSSVVICGTAPSLKFINEPKSCILSSLNSFKCIDLSNEMVFDDGNTELPNVDAKSQISESLSSSNLPVYTNKNDCDPISTSSNETIKKESSIFEQNKSELDQINFVGAMSKNCDNFSISSNLPKCKKICSFENMIVNTPYLPKSDVNEKIASDYVLEHQKISNSMDLNVSDNTENIISDNKNLELVLKNEVELNAVEEELTKEYNSYSPNYCLDDSFTSGPLTDTGEKIIHVEIDSKTNLNKKLETQQSSECVNKYSETVEHSEKETEENKKKKKKKKKVLDVDECSWEDMFDKEDDYIHPLLMKELVASMGKVQVKCAKEDYRSHQTIEERSGDGECVIEVYGFSSDLKTVDLMNQFAAFRRKHFEIIWVDDTHALAVFESPNLADRALNTSFALVKTRPLKSAIRESKLKAETVAPLPATRPKTCTAMARRLVSSALGLKMNVSPDLLNAERTLLANAKEKKIREAQQKHNIWNTNS